MTIIKKKKKIISIGKYIEKSEHFCTVGRNKNGLVAERKKVRKKERKGERKKEKNV